MDTSLYGSIRALNDTARAVREIIKIVKTHIGEYKTSARTSDFSGWLLCDGRSLSRAGYPDLYDIIGTSFGSIDSESFSLPDFRGRVMGSLGQGIGLTDRALGHACGEETHVLGVLEMPQHLHTGATQGAGSHNHSGSTGTGGIHSHSTNATGGSVGLAVADGTNTVTSTDPSPGELDVWTTPRALEVANAGDHGHFINNDGIHGHSFTTDSAGNGLAHNMMQPTLFAGNIFMLAKFVI